MIIASFQQIFQFRRQQCRWIQDDLLPRIEVVRRHTNQLRDNLSPQHDPVSLFEVPFDLPVEESGVFLESLGCLRIRWPVTRRKLDFTIELRIDINPQIPLRKDDPVLTYDARNAHRAFIFRLVPECEGVIVIVEVFANCDALQLRDGADLVLFDEL